MNLREKLRIPTNPADRDLLALCVFVGLAFFGMMMTGPLVPLVLIHMKASPGLLGAVISVSAIGSLLVAVPGGVLVGKWGSAKMMSLSMLLCAATTLFLTFFPSIVSLFIGLVFFEIGKILFIVGAQAHIGNLGEGRDLNLDFGWYGMANAVGQLLGPFSAGLVIDFAGHAVTWAIMTGILLLIGLTLPRFVSNIGLDKDLPPKRSGEPKKKKGFRHYINDYAIIAIIASFAVLFADGARTTFFPVLMNGLGYSATAIGFFLSLRALVSMSVRGFMGQFIKAVGGRFPALIISIVVMAVGIGITPFCDNYLTLTINAILVGIGLGLSLPLSMATVSEGVPPEDRGVAMGIRLTGNRLAQLANPIFFGVLAQNLGFSLAFIAGGVVLLLCALPIFIWWRDRAGKAG
ncbi:MAG: MFS transporter [Treponemataceae bacterium]